jgi:hypothetical protein
MSDPPDISDGKAIENYGNFGHYGSSQNLRAGT